MKKIHVIIPAHHQNKAVSRSISTALQSEQAEVHILVVDNDSDGRWMHDIWGQEPRLEWLVNPGNPGTGAALNQGIEKALNNDTDLVFILQPGDCVEPLTLKILAGAAGAAGLATPRVVDSDGHVQDAGGSLDLLRSTARLRGRDDAKRGSYEKAEKVSWGSLHGLMISAKALQSGIRFHEDYFSSWEDVDFCVSMRKAGFSVIYAAQSILRIDRIDPETGKAARQSIYYRTRNRFTLLMRHGNCRQKLAGFLYLVSAVLSRALLDTLRGNRLHGRARLIGLIDGMHQRMGPLRS